MNEAIERIEQPELTSRENLAWHMARYVHAASLVRGGDRVLDAGCGVAYGARMLAEAGATVVACDIAEQTLVKAAGRFEPASFLAADLHRLPFADASFDGVASFEVLEHLEAPGTFLDECKRVVAPGGWCVVSTPNPRYETDNPFHTHELSVDELRELLATRFSEVEILGQPWSVAFTPAGLGSRVRDLDRFRLRRVLPQRARDLLRRVARADGEAVGAADLDRVAVARIDLDDANPYVAVCRV